MSDVTEPTGSPWARKGSITAAVFVLLLVVAAVVLAFVVPAGQEAPVTGGGQTPSGTGTVTPSTSPSTETSTAPAPGSAACDLPAGDSSVPSTTPTDTQWELVGRVVVPSAPDVHGPGITEPVRSCFARTPLGALYAATNVVATTSLPDAPRLLAERLGAAGAGRDVAVSQLPPADQVVPADEGAQLQIAGFSFLSYTDDETVVDLALSASTNSQAATVHTPITLRWERGDWRLVYGPDGSPFPVLEAVPNLAGYIPWSGT